MRKQFLKSMLLALLCVVGGVTSAWADSNTLLEYGTANVAWTTDNLAEWTAGGNPTLADGIVTISGGNGGYATSKTITPTANSIIKVTAVWRGSSSTGRYFSEGNGSYFRFGNIYAAQNDQDKKHGYGFNGIDNISSTTTFTAGSYRVDIASSTWLLIEAEINTASNTLTSFTIKSEDGKTTYVSASNVALASPDYTTVAFGYKKGGSVKTTNFEQLKSIKITETTQSVQTANFTVKFVDEDGKELKDSETNNTIVGETPNVDAYKGTIYIDDYKYVYKSDNASTSPVAADGNTTVTIVFTAIGKTQYIVNAKDEAGATLKTYTVDWFPNENVTVYYNHIINANDTWYSIGQNNAEPFYGVKYTNAEGGTTDKVYSKADEKLTYYKEAEDLNINGEWAARGAGGAQARFSNGIIGRLAKKTYIYTEPLDAGIYTVVLKARNQSSTQTATIPLFLLTYDDEQQPILTDLEKSYDNWGKAEFSEKSIESVKIPEGASLVFYNNTDYNSNLELDYIFLLRTANIDDLEFTVKYVDQDGKEIKASEQAIGKEIAATDEMKASFDVDDKRYFFASEKVENGMLILTFREAATWSYTVKNNINNWAVSGTAFEGTKLQIGFPQYQNVDGTLYQASAINSEYRKTFTLSEDNQEETVEYTATQISDVVFLAEAEDIEGMTTSTINNIPIRSSKAECGYASEDVIITHLEAGKYKLAACIYKNNSGSYNYTFTAGEDNTIEFTQNGSTNGSLFTSDAFTLTEATDVVLKGGTSDATCVDYIYIVKADNQLAAGKYYLRNVGAQKFWGAANNWGTKASLVDEYVYVTLAQLNDGTYTMESMVSNGGKYYFDGNYMDGAAAPLTIAKSGDYWTIANSNGELFGYDGTSTVLGKNIAAGNDNTLWEALTEEQVQAEITTKINAAAQAATIDKPADMTLLLLKDPNFGRNRRDASTAWNTTDKISLAGGGDNGNGVAEAYMLTFDAYQTIAGMPNGVYKLSAQAAVTFHDNRTVKDYDGNGYPLIYAGETTANFLDMETADRLTSQGQLGAQFTAGKYYVEPIFVEVTDGTLKVGAKSTRADIWAVWDNFQLSYYGDVSLNEVILADYIKALNEAIAETETFNAGQNKIGTAEQTALTTAYETAKAIDLDNTTQEALIAATNALTSALAAANTSATLYANGETVIAKASSLLEKHNFATEEAISTFNTAITNASTAYSEGTLTQTMIDNLGMSVTRWHDGANTAASNYLENGFQLNDFDAALYVNTWSTEGATDNSGFEVPFYEYWTANENSLGANTFTGTLTGLDNGLYNVKATVRVNVKNGVEDLTTATGITMQVNDGETVDVTKGTQVGTSRFLLKEYTAEGLVKDGNLSLTFNIAEGNNISWLSFQHVYYNKERDLTPEEIAIGEGTPSLANGSYTQQNTLDISFNEAVISDDYELAILDAEKITVNNKQAQATIKGNKLTVTLADLLSTGTEYVVTLAAGAVGYSAQNANSEQTFTVKTPELFDGTYYIATNEEQPRYISRGGDSQTEAALDRYGIAAKFTTDAENVTHITFVDNNKNLFGGSQSIYTDKTEADLGNDAARARFTIEQGQNGFAIYNPLWNKYIAAGTGAESGAQAAVYAEEPYYWNLMNAATHAQLTATYKDRNALAVAEAAGLTNVANAAQLNEAITANGWMSKNIELANSYSSVTESWQYANAPAIIAEQQLTGLEQGIYKVSLSGFHRMASNDATYELNKQLLDGSTTYLWANDQQLQFPSVMSEGADVAYTEGWNPNYAKDDKNYPNSMGAAGQAFSNGLYTIEVFAYVGEDGKLSLGATAPAKYKNSNWICWRDLKVTYYTEFVGDYSQLEQTVATCEKYTLGFEANEYAPYQNAEKLIALKQAQALLNSHDATTQTEIDALNTTLSTGWTANSEEVNAIFWKTDYTAADKAGDGYVHPIGWTNTGYNTRVMNSELTSDAAMQTIGTAVFSKFNTTYGEKEGYTMPLKASTVYNISFRYCGWGNNPTTNVVLSVDGEEVAVTPTSFRPATNDGNTNAEHWYEYNGYFTTTKAGNYVLALNKVDQGQQQIAWTNLTLKRAVAEDITIAETEGYTPAARYGNVTFKRTLVEGWNGLTVPFDMTIDKAKSVFNATEVKTFSGIKLNDDETVTLCFGNANSVEAGVPFLIKVSEAGSSYEIGTVMLSDNAAEKPVTYTAEGKENIRYTMEGSYAAETDLTNVVFALIQGNKFFYHNTGKDSSAKAFRAWFVNESTDAETAARLRFDLGDDETTGIKSIANDADSLTATYDLQGRVVKTAAKKGLYIKNGKKMVVK